MPASRPTVFAPAALALALGLAFGGSARAQSLQEVYEAARGYDASFLAARALLDSAQYRAEQAKALNRPSVGLQVQGQRSTADTPYSSTLKADTNTVSAGLSASQSLYNRANSVSIEQAEKSLAVSRADFESAEQDLIVRVAQAYFDVLAAQDTLATTRTSKAAIAEQLASAKRNFEVGTATITDTREAQARFDLATAQEIATENDLRVRKLALDQLVGRSGSEPRPLAQPITLPAPQPDDVTAWVERAAEQHPGVRQARAALDIARLETDKARTGHRPTVDLQASVGQTRYPDGNPSLSAAPRASARTTNASIGVVLNWPLFAGFAVENRIRETLSLEDRAQADLDQLQRSVS